MTPRDLIDASQVEQEETGPSLGPTSYSQSGRRALQKNYFLISLKARIIHEID